METAPVDRRARLGRARLYWILTPPSELEPGGAAAATWLDRIAPALAHVDAVQVRPKARPDGSNGAPVSDARLVLEWTRAVLARADALEPDERPLVFVNDRVDVARALLVEGVDGVHVGDGDTPAAVARDVLGPDALIGVSTHTAAEVVEALDAPVDLLGFGPVFPTATKGYDGRVGFPLVGPERAWVAADASPLPLFPIGGIDLTNAAELDRVGRAAVGAAITDADDPAGAAAGLRELLAEGYA